MIAHDVNPGQRRGCSNWNAVILAYAALQVSGVDAREAVRN
jgi:hypothetical protein